jgi:hypothetical protein
MTVNVMGLSIECCYAEYRKQALYADCHYAECRYAECHWCQFTRNALISKFAITINTTKICDCMNACVNTT